MEARLFAFCEEQHSWRLMKKKRDHAFLQGVKLMYTPVHSVDSVELRQNPYHLATFGKPAFRMMHVPSAGIGARIAVIYRMRRHITAELCARLGSLGRWRGERGQGNHVRGMELSLRVI